MNKIGFDSTSAMLNWIYNTVISGPVVILDKWTYGLVEVSADKSWKTIDPVPFLSAVRS